MSKLEEWAPKIDQYAHRRLTIFTRPMAIRLAAIASVILAVSFLPVILIPWGVVTPSLVILLFALGMMTRDGYSMLLGWLICPVWLYLLAYLM